jgi:PPM family protein phosphatase
MFWKKWFGLKPRSSVNSNELIELDDIKAIVVTDVGNIRTNNEDMGLFVRIADERIKKNKGHLLLVADGMGGHNAGEIASRMAAETISREYFRHKGSVESSLLQAFNLANRKIYEASKLKTQYRGMGTTCTAVVIKDDQIYYAHVGDSRAYLYTPEGIRCITTDHTLVQEMIKKGEIAPEEADSHPKRNILTNAMGTKPELSIDVGLHDGFFENQNKILICSDGLYEYLNNQELFEKMSNENLRTLAGELINEAKNRGGHDNITAVLIERRNTDKSLTSYETRDIEMIPQTKEIQQP